MSWQPAVTCEAEKHQILIRAMRSWCEALRGKSRRGMVSRVKAWHRVARVVNWNERDENITDHGKRAEISRAKTEEVELVADVG